MRTSSSRLFSLVGLLLAAACDSSTDDVGADTRRFCTFLPVSGLGALPASRFAEAKRALEAKGRRA